MSDDTATATEIPTDDGTSFAPDDPKLAKLVAWVKEHVAAELAKLTGKTDAPAA